MLEHRLCGPQKLSEQLFCKTKTGLPEGVTCWNTAGMARKHYPSSCSARQKLALLASQDTSGKLCASLCSNPGLPEGVPCWNTAGMACKNYPSRCSARQNSSLLTHQATSCKLCASLRSNPGLPEGVPCWNIAGVVFFFSPVWFAKII